MKKFMKVCTITGAICLIIGTGISITAYAFGAKVKDYSIFPQRYFSKGRFISDMVFDETGTEKNDYSFKGVKSLSLDVGALYAEIVTEGNGDEIKVTFEGVDSDKYHYELDGNKLEIEWNGSDRNRFVTDVIKRKLKISVPAGFEFQDVELDISAAEINVKELKANQLEVDLKAGSVAVKNGTVHSLNADVKAGEMTFQGEVKKDIGVDCKAGSMTMELTGNEKDYNYKMDGKMGEIKIDSSSYTGMNFDKIVNHDAEKQMNLDCKTGEITVKFQE